MNRFVTVCAAILTTAFAHTAVHAAGADKKPVKPGVKASKPAQGASDLQRKDASAGKPVSKAARLAAAKKAEAIRVAEALRAAEEALEPPVSDAQLEIAARVLTGVAECEFSQTVRVEPQHDRPGRFRVAYKKLAYTMVPEETTTGAVRLYDAKAGVVWLQIPTKSMLMDARAGQRVVDSCMQAEQRIAASAPASVHAGNALGWATPIPVAPVIASSLALPATQEAVGLPPVSELAASVASNAESVATLAVAPDASAPNPPAVQPQTTDAVASTPAAAAGPAAADEPK